MTLQDEINITSKKINTDGYPMSIGELMSLYKENELDIHPEFQRFFRWSLLQKTKLIESLLLSIPIPSIFVSQREDGIWDVIDGLQRLSTIFEFAGILKDEKGRLLPASRLVRTNYLQSLEGKYWDNQSEPENSLDDAQRIFIKRQKLDIKIVKKESDPNIKYELFQRLNSLGSKLTDQELRNCLLIMLNKEFYEWLDNISKDEHFLNCINLSEKSLIEKFNQELVLRFIVFRNASIQDMRQYDSLAEFITEHIIKLYKSTSFNKNIEEEIFRKTFLILDQTLGEDTFKKFESTRNRFEGKFLISAFESIAVGLGKNIDLWRNIPLNAQTKRQMVEKVKSLWQDNRFTFNIGSGSNYNQRIPQILPIGEQTFRP